MAQFRLTGFPPVSNRPVSNTLQHTFQELQAWVAGGMRLRGQARLGERIGYNSGYTENMKTAVSVPDDLFRLAEVAARRLRVSRSQLYATAVSEFLSRQQGGEVTERLNEVYSRRPAKVDSALHRAQLRSTEKGSW
jgi:hypothetical protein